MGVPFLDAGCKDLKWNSIVEMIQKWNNVFEGFNLLG
jgi:hypothetical protein